MPNLSELGRQSAEEHEAQTSDYERYEVTDHAFGRAHPTTAVEGEVVAVRGWNPNEDSEYDNDPRGGIVLRNPTIATDDDDLSGTVIAIGDPDRESDDFKVINEDDEATNVSSDLVDFDGNTYYYDELTDEFPHDEIVLKVGGSVMRNVLRRLDAAGSVSAGVQTDEDGAVVLSANGFPMQNVGLFEFNDDSDEMEYRFARDPVLRDDLEGETIGIMVQRRKDVDEDYDGRAYWTTVYRYDEDGEAQLLRPVPTDEADVPVGVIVETGWLEWSYPDEGEYEISSGGLSDQEIAAIDKIEESAPIADLDRAELEQLVTDNRDLFQPDTDIEEAVAELESRA